MYIIALIRTGILIHVVLILRSTLFAQVVPAVINPTESLRLPDVFALAENHFVFETESPIARLSVLSDTAQWVAEKGSDSSYIINCKVCGRSRTEDLDSIVRLRLILVNGDSIELVAPVRPYADILIQPYPSKYVYGTDSLLKCDDQSGFRASWNYPAYAKKRWRVYGVFDMEVIANGERIGGFTGWYDSGDRTRIQDFSAYSSFKDVQFKVTRVRTLYRFTQNGEMIPHQLAEGFPSVWYLKCDDGEH